MTFTDIHSHTLQKAENSIYNCTTGYIAGRNISIGIHPWNITEEWRSEFQTIAAVADAENVLAIGECGLDTIKSPAPLATQEEILLAHATLAEELKKPLIIHCVKAYDRLIALHKELKPQQAWIIHGFRGKPALAAQLIKAGFHISLGEKFNAESAKSIPIEKLFIESDESRLPIADIYAAVAAAKGVTVEELAKQITENTRIFKQFRCNNTVY